ncbi:hypothetical protein HPB52_009564 [Rhipicephalus sanguineus]|uniref:Uncharacterized protein n=1 Tax=Rhipicephalus sanguineus TaxID=34632 RepID=A0A9D4PJ92_RHISA|nr:hypothetical protein HPB52_009564 [Rhipicephalus sanguineus]
MELKKWCSNSRLLCDRFLNYGLSLENVTEQSSMSKLLGLLWDRSSDDIIITTQGVLTFVSSQPDSTIALHWISGDAHRLETFVRNRVQEIRTLTRRYNWRHCVSADNSADLTRGLSAAGLTRETKWWTGPPWLTKLEGSWPLNPCSALTVYDLNGELASVCRTAVSPQAIHPHTPLLDLKKYSSLSRLLRVAAGSLRFVCNASRRQASLSGPLTSLEVDHAERYWIRLFRKPHSQ